MLVGKDRFVNKSWIWEVIDFKPDSSAGIKIHVMDEERNTFDEQRSKILPQLNLSWPQLYVECPNPTCEAVKRSEYVMIQSGHIIDCDLRSAMQSLNCSSCEARISLKVPHSSAALGRLQFVERKRNLIQLDTPLLILQFQTTTHLLLLKYTTENTTLFTTPL